MSETFLAKDPKYTVSFYDNSQGMYNTNHIYFFYKSNITVLVLLKIVVIDPGIIKFCKGYQRDKYIQYKKNVWLQLLHQRIMLKGRENWPEILITDYSGWSRSEPIKYEHMYIFPSQFVSL